MHRRARHFNAKSAEASLVMDSRFLSGLSATDPISTWTARHGSDSTATTTARPTYEVGGPGGVPVARFNGSTNLMTITTPPSASEPWSAICVYKRRTTAVLMLPIGTSVTNSNPQPVSENANGINYVASTGGYWQIAQTTTAWTITASIFASVSALEFFRVGVSVSVGSRTSLAGQTTFSRIGGRPSNFSDGDIAQIIVIPASISASVRRRLEQSAAFSFKISCS